MVDSLFYIVLTALVGYFFWMWLQDCRANAKAMGQAAPGNLAKPEGMPGAVPARFSAVLVAVVGALVILAVEVAGEYKLGVVEEQKEMAVLFGVYTLAAAFAEELIFRGFLFFDRGSKWQLYASIVLISFLFAFLHPYIWTYDVPPDQQPLFFWKWLRVDESPKAIFTTGILLANSLWFYFVRLYRLNPTRSLLPCVAAHFASNLGVFAVKAWQGKVVLLD